MELLYYYYRCRVSNYLLGLKETNMLNQKHYVKLLENTLEEIQM